jgi:predicted Rossmann fold nucleotide-binding protein DprA/Smf involved in DNA uptake
MNAAFELDGHVVGVLADALSDAVRRPSTRRAISGGTVCLVTPYAPTAGFSAGNAMGRNKIIYGLCRAVVVVRSDEGTGGTWSGAVEALRKRWTPVLSWTGPGSAQGNRALLAKGAFELTAMDELKTHLSAEPVVAAAAVSDPGAQLSLPI